MAQGQLACHRTANWVALNDTLDGLASAVYGLGEGTVQSQVLIGTSLLEGLHRRLPYQQSQFPEASSSAREHVKKAARHAAAERARTVQKMDFDLVHTAVKDAVGHFEDVGYRTRAQDITSHVADAVPELAESIPDLPEKLTTARNELAHHLVLSDEKEPFDTRINRWVVISYVTPWLLRLLLLLHAGVKPDSLRTACLDSDKFGFLRANLAAIARDLEWPSTSELLLPVTRKPRRPHGHADAGQPRSAAPADTAAGLSVMLPCWPSLGNGLVLVSVLVQEPCRSRPLEMAGNQSVSLITSIQSTSSTHDQGDATGRYMIIDRTKPGASPSSAATHPIGTRRGASPTGRRRGGRSRASARLPSPRRSAAARLRGCAAAITGNRPSASHITESACMTKGYSQRASARRSSNYNLCAPEW